jgi:hypothetical protein
VGINGFKETGNNMQCFVPYKVMDKKYEAQAINFVKIAAAFTHKCKSTDLACSILVQKLVSKKKERRQMKHFFFSNTQESCVSLH